MDIYRKTDKNEIQFDFVVYNNDREYAFEEEIKILGGNVYRMPRYKGSNHFTFRKAWRQLLKQHPEWSIIHIHNTSTAVLWMGIAKRLKRITIAHSRTGGGQRSIFSCFKIIMRYPLRYKADYLFAVSEKAAKWMFGKHSSKTTVIKNAIDVDAFAFDSEIRGRKREELLLEGKLVIGHVGRFFPEKNHGFIIDIFAQLVKHKPDSVLLLVGDGDLRTEIACKVKNMGLEERVVFAGVRDDVADLLQAMDVFLFPSVFEGMPGAVIEAQAAGLFCVISDSITGEVHITNLVKALPINLSADVWAKEVLNLAETPNCRNTSGLLKDAGFDTKDVVEKISAFYADVCKS